MPGWHILVRQSRSDIEHDDGALSVNVVPISQPTKLLLPCCVPAVESQLSSIGCEIQRMHFHSNCGCRSVKISPGWELVVGFLQDRIF